MKKLSLRRWILGGALSAAVSAGALYQLPGLTAADAPKAEAPKVAADAAKGQLTVESLGTLLSALGLKATRTESRYDFQFAATHGEEWTLSMSVVLSNDEKTLWVMAWLDELPKTAQDVPRTSLLRMLSDNDRMGSGQFFAYISTNRRFVLERVVANERITSAGFREILTELGRTVANTYPHWHTSFWKQSGNPAESNEEADTPASASDKSSNGAAPANNSISKPAPAAPSTVAKPAPAAAPAAAGTSAPAGPIAPATATKPAAIRK